MADPYRFSSQAPRRRGVVCVNFPTHVNVYPRKASQLARRGHLKISITFTREDEKELILGYEVLLEILVIL